MALETTETHRLNIPKPQPWVLPEPETAPVAEPPPAIPDPLVPEPAVEPSEAGGR